MSMNKSSKKKYYEFDDDKCQINILRPDTPSPWVNYLSNGKLSAFVSQAGGGFAWYKSPASCRLTRYRHFNQPIDSPGFYVYLRNSQGKVFSPSWRPVEESLDKFKATHQGGLSSFKASRFGIEAHQELYITPDDNALIWDITVTNLNSSAEKIDLFCYVEFSQLVHHEEADWGYYRQYNLKNEFSPKDNALMYLSRCELDKNKQIPLIALGCSDKIFSYETDRDRFCGAYRSERNPIAVENGICESKNFCAGHACGALHNKLVLESGQSTHLYYYLAIEDDIYKDYHQCRKKLCDTLARLKGEKYIESQKKKLLNWWDERYKVIQVTGIDDLDISRQINTWNVVNSVTAGHFSRSVNTWAPGIRGVGFRDTCQDMLAIAYRDPPWATNIFKYLISLQYPTGDVLHYAYPHDDFTPVVSSRSDNHLWLPFLAYAIAAETGNMKIFEEKIPYLDPKDSISATKKSATVWEHLMQAVQFTELHLGGNGIPLTLKSDWNDIIGKFNCNGKGESVFAGMQYLVALDKLIEISKFLSLKEDCRKLQQFEAKQRKALLQCAWDGQWWLRGFDGNGKAVGSSSCENGQLFLNPQSWAVLAGLGEKEQQIAAMDVVAKKLDTGYGLTILTPPFPTFPDISDPFSPYAPGTGENGAIFCHANTWAIMAEATLKRSKQAWKYFRQLIPHVAAKNIGIDTYKIEPYAWCSNIIGPDHPDRGRGGVSHISGTATWMDIAVTQYLLGIKPCLDGLKIAPLLPSEWKNVRVKRKFRNKIYEINLS